MKAGTIFGILGGVAVGFVLGVYAEMRIAEDREDNKGIGYGTPWERAQANGGNFSTFGTPKHGNLGRHMGFGTFDAGFQNKKVEPFWGEAKSYSQSWGEAKPDMNDTADIPNPENEADCNDFEAASEEGVKAEATKRKTYDTSVEQEGMHFDPLENLF